MSHRPIRTGGSLPYRENFVAQRPLFSVNGTCCSPSHFATTEPRSFGPKRSFRPEWMEAPSGMRPATGWRWQIEKICLNSFLIWVWTWDHSLRINWSRSSIGQSREPDFTKGSLKQTTARHQRAHELLREFTQVTPKWARPWRWPANQIAGQI